MAIQVQRPNLFDLKDRKASLSYTPAGIGGKASLIYVAGDSTRTFGADDITVTETPAGTLVSVLVEIFPDVRTKTLNLLVPVINLPDGATEFPVETIAVLASKSVLLGGPRTFRGQAQTYETLKLTGVARVVDF
jgi:hypothetical protein